MYLSRIRIANFRNFAKLDIQLTGNVVLVGENRVGKSNLIHALRLVLDASLPDAARQLSIGDFWDGLGSPGADDKIEVCIEVKKFDTDYNLLACLTDYRLHDDQDTVRLTFEFRPKAGLEETPSSDIDYEFICFGGEDDSRQFGHELRRRITLDVLPALRDVEGDLRSWKRSPLRPLVETAMKSICSDDLKAIGGAIESAAGKLTDFEHVLELEKNIAMLFVEMGGESQNLNPKLGISPTDPTRLHRNIQLLIDQGLRGISDASLGSANLVFLTLKTLELRQLIEDSQRDHTFLVIEESEAHLHPHLQRTVYQHLFASIKDDGPLSVFLTTHSPHIASVAPLKSIVLLKQRDNGTSGTSASSISLDESEVDDLQRYIDVNRAEILFSRGVILVEGDAERFLVPVFSQTMGHDLDKLGISVCSVAGTNFKPYVKFLTGLGIPFSVITDWDPKGKEEPLGVNRTRALVGAIEMARNGEIADELQCKIDDQDHAILRKLGEEYSVFLNEHTLEVDLFFDGYHEFIVTTLREHGFGEKRSNRIDEWEANPDGLNAKQYLAMIEEIGKGRFAQRLAVQLEGIEQPAYIGAAIEFVVNRV